MPNTAAHPLGSSGGPRGRRSQNSGQRTGMGIIKAKDPSGATHELKALEGRRAIEVIRDHGLPLEALSLPDAAPASRLSSQISWDTDLDGHGLALVGGKP